MNEKNLTKKELEFCRWFARLQNSREAAVKAGFSVLPEYRALSLLSRKNIQNKIEELQNETATTDALVCAGLKRLAFGSSSDAVKLLLSADGDTPSNIDTLDLFNVSEIKYTKGKGMEIKFFDRFKALEKLCCYTESSSQSDALSFYEALERSTAKNSDGDTVG